MVTAWLVTNEFLNTEKYTELNMWLVDAAKENGIELLIKTNAELLVAIGAVSRLNEMLEREKPTFVIFWDKDIRLAEYLESIGLRLYNRARSIEICDNKAMTHIVLNKNGIRMPKTIIAPMTYENIGYKNYSFLTDVSKELSFPLVVKESFGSFGQQVYLVHDQGELLSKVQEIRTKPMIFQEYIKASFARDIRINVVGREAVATMFRYSETGDFRANISNGGRMRCYEPSKEQIDLAVRCVEAIGLDFAGVDLLFDEEEQPIVCEVNSNAHFKNIFDCTKVNVAKHIIDYICNDLQIR
ncbi:MAG TPA: RimK family alpha-L-glutamate ligase [Lachnospiraceae bacterium]|nr:RimK family alpha-L-glutamate ligase [Lachnospiraceae bacterium]